MGAKQSMPYSMPITRNLPALSLLNYYAEFTKQRILN